MRLRATEKVLALLACGRPFPVWHSSIWSLVYVRRPGDRMRLWSLRAPTRMGILEEGPTWIKSGGLTCFFQWLPFELWTPGEVCTQLELRLSIGLICQDYLDFRKFLCLSRHETFPFILLTDVSLDPLCTRHCIQNCRYGYKKADMWTFSLRKSWWALQWYFLESLRTSLKSKWPWLLDMNSTVSE